MLTMFAYHCAWVWLVVVCCGVPQVHALPCIPLRACVHDHTRKQAHTHTHIRTCAQVDTNLCLVDVYGEGPHPVQFSGAPKAPKDVEYKLRCMFCYYGQHYFAFILKPEVRAQCQHTGSTAVWLAIDVHGARARVWCCSPKMRTGRVLVVVLAARLCILPCPWSACSAWMGLVGGTGAPSP